MGAGAPVNHVLPAWDIAAGLYLATALLAAERHRSRTGAGQEVVAALTDVMLAMVGHLGYIGDVQINGRARPALGNDLYGSFGRDFATADGRRVMIIALTPRQWRALGRATGLAEQLAMVGHDDGGRSRHRERAATRRAMRSPRSSRAGAPTQTLAEIARGLCRHRRAVGAVSGFCRAGPRRPALLGGQPAVRRGRAARDRPLSDAGPAARLRRRAAPADPAGAAPRRAHRRGAGASCSASPPPRSAGCTMPASSPGWTGVKELPFGFADLPQHVAHAARGAEFSADIGGEAQIALRLEPARLGVGRQFAHDLGKGAEDRLDSLCVRAAFRSPRPPASACPPPQ